MTISDFGIVISDFQVSSAINNRAEGELGEANPQSAINNPLLCKN